MKMHYSRKVTIRIRERIRISGIVYLWIQLLCWQSLQAQLFPGIEGEALVEEIQQYYTPSILLNETQVKDTLYGRIFLDQDSVRCIYSGLARFLPSGVDPSQWLFGTGLEVTSMNLEHSWPQAKGAGKGTNGQMDMHHLFPSRTDINSDRANFPYSDIQDHLTQKWYYRDKEMGTIPVTHQDAYSEYMAGTFEPRESVKGDIARAMMYFWTIYREDALAADPLFFDIQRNTFCAWHVLDPVDGVEAERTERIAMYQDGKPNPFILDCTLAIRAYCPELSDCGTVSVSHADDQREWIEFNPVLDEFRIASQLKSHWLVRMTDAIGQIVFSDEAEAGIWYSTGRVPTGIYYIKATTGQKSITRSIFIVAD